MAVITSAAAKASRANRPKAAACGKVRTASLPNDATDTQGRIGSSACRLCVWLKCGKMSVTSPTRDSWREWNGGRRLGLSVCSPSR